MLRWISVLSIVSCCWSASADTSAFKIVDDDTISSAMAEVRAEYLKDKTFDRLDATILIKQPDGTWKRGSFNPDALNYPASCVKLCYLAAAMRWCRENGHPYDYLDHAVKPMIEISDNIQTGVVVDAITSAPNIADLTSASDPRFGPWMEARRYTESQLARRGLLGGQTIFNKTYPANSSPDPSGSEKVAREVHGMNRMSPRMSASLMLEIVGGAWEPAATKHMRKHLTHTRFRGSSYIGNGIPPGSIYENKTGFAYDTVEDIAHVILPNNQEFVLAVFTNAARLPYSRDRNPYGRSILAGFSELLIDRLKLTEGCPPMLRLDDAGEGFKTTGEWATETTPTQFGAGYRVKKAVAASDASATTSTAVWDLNVPQEGLYELCVRYPQSEDRVPDATYFIDSSDGSTSTTTVNQKRAGGQWVRLGDFQFAPGKGRLTLSDKTTSAGTVAADGVRAYRWPDNPLKLEE